MATAFVHGLQGSDPHVWITASLLKHFLANSNEDNRAGSSSNFDERLFHEYYAVPFRMAIENGHADAMMTAYNAWNGVPMAANPVLRTVVMKDWGFNGILCTDAGALTDMVTQHHAFPDLATAAAAAIHAGINQFLDNYRKPVEDALARGLITEADVDANLRGVYRVMLRLGLLNPAADSPYARIGESGGVASDPWNETAARQLARQVTDESIVLLKNADGTLPLDASATHSVAVIGPWANTVALDWYSGTPPFAVTPLEGITKRLPGASVVFNDGSDYDAAAALAARSQVAVVIVGNHPTCDAGWGVCADPGEGKEGIDRTSLTLTDEGLVKAVLKANPHAIVVLQTSFPYSTVWTEEHAPAILEMTHNSEEQGDALADVLFGSFDPAGKLTQTWPASIDQLPSMMNYDIRQGRNYMYAKFKPLYPFGYGLSYTQFQYSAMHADESGGAVHIELTLRNTGNRDGADVVQIYAAHENSKVSRPLEQLVAFERVTVPSGASREVALDVPLQRLAYWDETDKRFVLERDRVEFRAGSSSADIRLRQVLAIGPAEAKAGAVHGGN
jgi:beta-glucosidase